MTNDQKLGLLVGATNMAKAIVDGSPAEILKQVHTDLGYLIDALPAMPADLTDAAAARDTAIVDAAEDARVGLR